MSEITMPSHLHSCATCSNVPYHTYNATFTDLNSQSAPKDGRDDRSRGRDSTATNHNDPFSRYVTPVHSIDESDTQVTIRMEIPGVNIKDIDVEVSNNQRRLNVQGSRKALASDDYHLKFDQVFEFDTEIDVDQMNVSLSDGVLMLVIRKLPSVRSQKIKIDVKEKQDKSKEDEKTTKKKTGRGRRPWDNE
mmetsp:Transcript_4199/g.10945  ORF Transcript_4199/g.10945 Transcript_4199/m.10945 type:complete len:191 (-) Transcript_4199:2220-2792(-)